MLVRRLCVLGLGLLLTAPATAGADALRAREAALLGPEHAAEHARQRLLAERAAAAPAAPGGAPVRVAASDAPGDEAGRWAAPVPLPVIAINAAMLPTGKVLMFAYPARPGYPGYDNLARAYVWDPATGASEQIDPPVDPATGKPTNIWCGGTSFLADGRVLVTGGNVDDPLTDFHGLDTVFTFDPFTQTWATHEHMDQGRWYPGQLLMPDGRTLILSGLTKPGDRDYSTYRVNSDVEVFSPNGTVDRLEDFRLGDPGRPELVDLYPHVFWMPSGRALVAGPQPQDSWMMPAPHAGAPTQWVDIPNLAGYRYWSTAVELGGGRVMVLGGSDRDREGDEPRLPTASTEIFDESDPAAGWRQGPPLAVERSHANSVLLPDGTVATVGGGYGEVGGEYYRWEYDPERHTHVELYDPRTGSVTLGPAQTEGRTYHSTALLLPDGRVMSAGDDVNGRPTQDNPTGTGTGTSDDTAEIYSPPYLFRGPRPRIAAAPAHVAHGARFEVRTPDGDVERAVLVAPGAVTHAVDTNQRVVELARPVRVPGEGYRLRAPSSRDVAPPGYYMLFLLDSKGVPSVAPFVRLGPGAPRPVLGALAVIPARFRAGARVSYTLSDPGKVRFTVVRAGSKRGAFTHRANRGLNRFTFTGRLRGRRLPPGRYRLRAVATDLAGNRSRRRSVRFSIAR